MARDSVFDYLSEIMKKLPEEVEKAAIESTQAAVHEYGIKMFNYLKQHGGKSLSDHIFYEEKLVLYDKNQQSELARNDYVIFYVDWEDGLVNPDRKAIVEKPRIEGQLHVSSRGKVWRGQSKAREGHKRNFSKNPATWHDLAYILAAGRTVVGNDGHITIIPPKHFLTQGVRRKNGWKSKQTKLFAVKLDELARSLK